MLVGLRHVECVELCVKRSQPGAVAPFTTRAVYQREVNVTGMLASEILSGLLF
jgi:hypothetical protein